MVQKISRGKKKNFEIERSSISLKLYHKAMEHDAFVLIAHYSLAGGDGYSVVVVVSCEGKN